MLTAALKRLLATALVSVYAGLVAAVVFLPLPGPTTRPPRQTIQLVPFQWIADMHRELRHSGFSLTHAVTTPAFEGAALNVLLFVPLGIFARMLFKRGLIGTALLGFGCSLFIETTQLTANWGTAAIQYRIFDVDDLLTNTTGAVLGWVAGALILALLATRRSAPGTQGAGYRPVAGAGLCHQYAPHPPGPRTAEARSLSYMASYMGDAAVAAARPVRPDVPTWPPCERPPVAQLADLPRPPLRPRP